MALAGNLSSASYKRSSVRVLGSGGRASCGHPHRRVHLHCKRVATLQQDVEVFGVVREQAVLNHALVVLSQRLPRVAVKPTKVQGVAPSRALSAPAVTPPVTPAPAAASAGGKRDRSSTSPDKLRTLFDRSLLVKSSDPVLRRLREEAVSLDIDEFLFAANDLLRALIEQTMTLYAKKNANGRWNDRLTDESLTHLCHEVLKANGVSGKALLSGQ